MNFNITEINNIATIKQVVANNSNAQVQAEELLASELAEAIEVYEMISAEEDFKQDEEDFTDKLVMYVLSQDKSDKNQTSESNGANSFSYFIRRFANSVISFFNGKKHQTRKKWLEKRKNHKRRKRYYLKSQEEKTKF